ncbi:hypothetical protein COS59_00460 [Candidatus Wolfebacteria bacterium CG03_land_8_20_14_0_80_36_15]|uniref:Uncharacterized protein n=1 Tax=Candidatus Wolfebacteria bacterium CG03_land_8_20_14_0_80_36_15 TaxID=1975067 RepID=A0A2M7B8A3_9BACT|nr:MAG: hypothetical protein COS59_00460 [Candidatus Wolfebacteria bacterium CG03_land_8_20_14_0_80_36_15]
MPLAIKKFLMRDKKDNFLIVSFLEDKLEIVVLQADFVNKDLEIKKIFKKEVGDDLSYLKKIFSSVFYPKTYKVIFNFDSNLAVTNFSSIAVLRDRPQETISEADFENLISQAIFNFFGPARKYASSRLNTSELETLICDVRIYNVLLDRHTVFDLLKEKGKRLDFYLSETFCCREFLKKLISFLPNRARVVFIAEGGSTLLHLISRYIKKPLLLAQVGFDKTSLFLKTKEGKINYFDSLKWGRNNLYLALAKELHVSLEVIKSIMVRYLENKTSTLFRRRLNFFLKKELALFNKGLEIMNSKAKAKCLIIDLEPSLAKDLKIKNISKKSLISIDVKTILDVFNFKLKPNHCFWYKNLYGLATLLESYFTPQEDLINKLARRRMRWLIP